jgi:hypothetical protein
VVVNSGLGLSLSFDGREECWGVVLGTMGVPTTLERLDL